MLHLKLNTAQVGWAPSLALVCWMLITQSYVKSDFGLMTVRTKTAAAPLLWGGGAVLFPTADMTWGYTQIERNLPLGDREPDKRIHAVLKNNVTFK
jgi:hypothetical protein